MDKQTALLAELKDYLAVNLTDNELKASNNKLEQIIRNRFKDDLTDLLCKLLKEVLEDEEQTILVERIKGAVGIGVNNEAIGLIPIQLAISLKNLDEDILDLGEEYEQSVKDKQEKARIRAEKVAKAKAKPRIVTKAEIKAEGLAE